MRRQQAQAAEQQAAMEQQMMQAEQANQVAPLVKAVGGLEQ